MYSLSVVLFQLRYGSVDLLANLIDCLLDAKIEGFGFEVLMVVGVLADAGGTQRHEAIF